MSGRCEPPANGSLRTKTSPGRGPVRDHRRDRLGHRAEVDGDVLGLGDHAAPGVEERGRAVAPLLDVRRERAPDEHRAHLLRDPGESRAHHGQGHRVHDRSRTRVPAASGSPAQPGRTRHVAPESSTIAGPATAAPGPCTGTSTQPAVEVHAPCACLARRRRRTQRRPRTGHRRDEPPGDQLRLAVEAEPVAALVRVGEADLPAGSVDGQLVGLAAVAGVDEAAYLGARELPLGALLHPCEARGRRSDVVAAQVGRGEPERAQHARGARHERRARSRAPRPASTRGAARRRRRRRASARAGRCPARR